MRDVGTHIQKILGVRPEGAWCNAVAWTPYRWPPHLLRFFSSFPRRSRLASSLPLAGSSRTLIWGYFEPDMSGIDCQTCAQRPNNEPRLNMARVRPTLLTRTDRLASVHQTLFSIAKTITDTTKDNELKWATRMRRLKLRERWNC